MVNTVRLQSYSQTLNLLEKHGCLKTNHMHGTKNNAVAVFFTVDLFIFKADFIALTPLQRLLRFFALQIKSYFGCNLQDLFREKRGCGDIMYVQFILQRRSPANVIILGQNDKR